MGPFLATSGQFWNCNRWLPIRETQGVSGRDARRPPPLLRRGAGRGAEERLRGDHPGARAGGAPRPLRGCVHAPGPAPGCPLRLPALCPTGGGKTILAAHAVAIARDAWIEKDHPLVLWLVPSNTIRIQTVQALKNTRHPYRQALDESFSGRVRVFDITDFSHVRPPGSPRPLLHRRRHHPDPSGHEHRGDARSTPTTRTWSPTSLASRIPCPALNGCRMGASSSPSRTSSTCTAR